MERLQSIVWPEIRLLAEERIKGLGEQGAEFAVLEAAVLLEAGWDDMCDEIWVVQVPPAVARMRLMKRNGLSEEQAVARISSQPMTNEERAARASVVISNDGSEEELLNKVNQVWNSRTAVLKTQMRRRSLVFVGIAAIVAAVIAAATSIVLQRGQAFT